MRIIRDQNAHDFLNAAGPLLYSREAEFGLALGLAEGIASGQRRPEGEALFLRVEEAGATRAALVQTRASNVVVTDMDQPMCGNLARYLREQGLVLGGAVGPARAARGLCEAYAGPHACELLVGMKILELTRVTRPPRPAPGRLKRATRDDLDAVYDYLLEFYRECLPLEMPTPEALRANCLERITRGTAFLWLDGERPVSAAHSSRETKNGISVNAVYTPRKERGKGYASSMMADLSQLLLDEGRRFCVLFTDVKNPTSNKIYESVGYRVIGTSEHIILRA